VLAWSGSTWTATASGVQGLYAISGVDASHIWAVGYSGGVVMWNGSVWIGQESTTTQYLASLFAVDATHVWAGGDAGTMLFYDGAHWAAQTVPTTSFIAKLWAADASHVWR
jgi:hypothetical protein